MIPKSVFNMLQFDEKTCDAWHLYEADYCLSCKRLGFNVYAVPVFVYHRSGGGFFKKSRVQILKSAGPSPGLYYQTLGKLVKKRKNYYKRIYTTCGDCNNSQPIFLQRIGALAQGGLKLFLRKLKWNL